MTTASPAEALLIRSHPLDVLQSVDLVPSLYLRTVSIIDGPANDEERHLEDRYAAFVLTGVEAVQQILAIHEKLVADGLSALTIKGGAHLLTQGARWLARHLSDIDLVVRPADLEAAMAALKSLGYHPEPWNSPADTLLMASEGPGLRMLHPHAHAVDLQTRIPGARSRAAAMEQVWTQAIPLVRAAADSGSADRRQAGIHTPSQLHEILLACIHYTVHLQAPLITSPKWLTDILLMLHFARSAEPPALLDVVTGASFTDKLSRIRPEELVWPFRHPPGGAERDRRNESAPAVPPWSWDLFWETARAWGSEDRAAVTCATLNAYWSASIGGVPAGADPVPFERAMAPERAETIGARAHLLSAYGERIGRLRALPTTSERLSYLVSLAIPAPENIRRRYQVPPARPLSLYYCRHVLLTVYKILRSMVDLVLVHILRRR